MADGFNEMPVRGKHLHNADIPDETAVATLPALAGAVAPSYTEGNVVALSADLAGNLRVVLSAGSDTEGATVSLSPDSLAALESIDLNAATVTAITSALESVDLNADTLTAITTALESVSLNADTRDDIVTRLSAAIEASHETTRSALESVDLNVATRDDIVTRLSAALESVDLNAATLAALEQTTPQVRGADVSDTNPLPVNIQVNPGTLVDSGLLIDDNVPPGGSTTLAGPAVVTGTGRLVEITAHASVRMKIVIRGNGVARRVFFADPSGPPLVYQPVDRDNHTIATGEVFDVVLTNMDNLRTADLYASITQVEF